MADNKFEAPEIESPNLLNQKSEWMESFNFGDYKSPAESVDNLIKELHAESNERKKADTANNESLEAIQSQFNAYVKSHRHDTLKQILITLLGCTVSFLLGYFLH